MTASAGDLLDARVRALVALYCNIAATRMRGLPLLNPALQVQAVGFELVPAPATTAANSPANALQPVADEMAAAPVPAAGVGVLITPWFMNLVWLPLQRLEAAAQVGRKVTRHVGQECFEFIGAHEDGFGRYEACSLFSPVFEFQSQEGAVATARAVLEHLRQSVPAAPAEQSAPAARDNTQAKAQAPAAAPGLVPPKQSSQPGQPGAPARRAFLFGRSAAANQAARPAVQPHEISGRG